MKTKPSTPFELDVCGRCSGTGRHSYNAVDLDKCYGCGGSGWKLTKRGAAAYAYFRNLKVVPIADVKAGDYVEYADMSKRFPLLVDSVTPDELNPGLFMVWGSRKGIRHGMGVWAGGTVTRVPTSTEQAALFEKAVAYQSTLTKAGKPRK